MSPCSDLWVSSLSLLGDLAVKLGVSLGTLKNWLRGGSPQVKELAHYAFLVTFVLRHRPRGPINENCAANDFALPWERNGSGRLR